MALARCHLLTIYNINSMTLYTLCLMTMFCDYIIMTIHARDFRGSRLLKRYTVPTPFYVPCQVLNLFTWLI